MINKIYFLLFFTISFGCETNIEDKENTSIKIQKDSISISPIINEEFNEFITKFSSDSIFQNQRIKFPIKLISYNTDTGNYENSLMDKSEWQYFNISELDTSKYIQQIMLNNANESTLKIQISDTGVDVSYNFQKINGLWYLINITDTST